MNSTPPPLPISRVVIAPQPGDGLTEAHASYDAITGRIASSWDISGGKLTMEVHLPPNTSATVRVPTANAAVVYEGPLDAAKALGVEFVRAEPGGAVFRVGSGTYRFMTPAPR